MKCLGKEYKSIDEIAREYNINPKTIRSRINRGYTIEEAILYDSTFFRKKSLTNLSYNHSVLSKDKVILKFREYGYEILNYSYKNNQTRMLCKNRDGYLVYMSYGALGKSKPYVFSINYNKDNFIYNANNYIKINGYKCVALNFRKGYLNKPDILCICACGEEYWYNFNEWKLKHIDLCPKCRKIYSRYENLVRDYLNSLQVHFKYQYRFEDCKNKKPLPFDFYLLDYNACIEVDGEQHFEGFHFDEIKVGKWATFSYSERKKIDNIKTSYCKNNNIRLLRVSYKDFKNNEYKLKINNFLTLY